MRKRNPKSTRQAGRFDPKGFTLVELLVVIAIIMLLAVILIPTIDTILLQAYAARSATRVKSLHDGIMLYKDRTKSFPGEKTKDINIDPRQYMNNQSNSGYTGSQVLAACMFGIQYNQLNSRDYSQKVNYDTIIAAKSFVPFEPGFLFTSNGKKNTIADGFPKGKTKAICYFLASNKLQHDNKVNQFSYLHNRIYMHDHSCGSSSDPLNQRAFEEWITDRSGGSQQILNNGEFILIAAGLDRDYLVDEMENPNDENRPIHDPDKDDIANDYSAGRN